MGLGVKGGVLGCTDPVGDDVHTLIQTARGAVWTHEATSRGGDSICVRKENVREVRRTADREADVAVRHREWSAHRRLFR